MLKKGQCLKIKWLQLESNRQSFWPFWLNNLVFVYELNGCIFESRRSNLANLVLIADMFE